MTDQQRGDALGIENHPVLQTPNMDFLARRGTLFRRGYSACPSCIPARRSLMTGTAPARNGMVGFKGDASYQPAHTLPGELSKAGYQTQLVGKLHMQPNRKRYGFDHMLRADSYRGGDNDYVDWLYQTHHRQEVDAGMAHGLSSNGWVGRPTNLPEEQMHTFWCFDQAMRFILKRDRSCPVFLKISTIDPHPPLSPPAFYYDRYIRKDLPMPVVGDWAKDFGGAQKGTDPNASEMCIDEDAMRCSRAGYYGLINFIDDQIGRFMQFAGNGLADNTLFIFTSDHGEMLGDHNLFRKCWPYEASARVPFIMTGPRSWKLPAENVCDTPVDLQDIMPTILDAAGIDVPDTCSGKSLLPIMRGETDGVREVLHGEHSGCYAYEHGNQWVTDGKMKYVWYTQTGREHLFDIEHDPNEMHDLTLREDAKAKVDVWRKKMIDVLKCRPEGFTDGSQLIKGREHHQFLPGYEPDRVYPFV